MEIDTEVFLLCATFHFHKVDRAFDWIKNQKVSTSNYVLTYTSSY